MAIGHNDTLVAKLKRLEYLKQLQNQQELVEKRTRIERVFDDLGFAPNPGPQSRFLDLPDDNLDVLYGGAVGGGKSVALLAYALRACVRFDGLQVYWFRCTYPELDTSVIKLLSIQFGFAASLGAKWVSSKYELTFPNGSVLKLTHAKNVQEATSLRSAEINLLILDERTTIPPDVVELLYTRVRSGTAGVPVLGIRSATNPGGPGHADVLEEYIRATDYGEQEIKDRYGRRRIFIQSRLTDTPQLMADGAYLASLQGLSEDSRRALLEGDWESFSGQMFGELSRERHVINPIELPATWRRYCGIDYGWRAPWAVIWGAVDEDGRIWLYRERYETEVKETDQAKFIVSDEGDEDVVLRFADDAMWVSRGEAKSIAQVYDDAGCVIVKAGKGPSSRKIGFARIHDFLAEAPACFMHRAMGWKTCPMLHMFTTCTNMFKELKNIGYATKGDPEDSDPKYADHLCLTADTLVRTVRGEVPIRSVASGDVVFTRNGMRRVVAAGLTARQVPVGSVVLSNGAILRGTANHPVWVVGRGWTRLDALRYDDILVSWEDQNHSCLTESPTVGTLMPNSEPIRCTSLQALRTGNEDWADCIKKYGAMFTVKYLTDTMFTTKMEILSTTTSKTLCACPERSIAQSTIRAESIRTGFDSHNQSLLNGPHSGTVLTKVGPGTASMVPVRGWTGNQFSKSATNAENRTTSGHIESHHGSAPTSANRSGAGHQELMTKTDSVMDAGRFSESTSTLKRVPVPVSVQESFVEDGLADTYNLTVEGDHEFFANGVLVHNCDALRYMLVNIGNEPKWHFDGTGDELWNNFISRQEQPTKAIGGYPVMPDGGDPWSLQLF